MGVVKVSISHAVFQCLPVDSEMEIPINIEISTFEAFFVSCFTSFIFQNENTVTLEDRFL